VTYGAGAFSIVNAIAGSQVEQVPVILINGAPTRKHRLNQKYGGIGYSHVSTSIPHSILCY
jgi:indolepyruvate decarboxylase